MENLNYRVQAGLGLLQASLTASWARPVPVGNSRADHSGNEHGGGGIPGDLSSGGSWERVVGGSQRDSEFASWSPAINTYFRWCRPVTVQWGSSRPVLWHILGRPHQRWLKTLWLHQSSLSGGDSAITSHPSRKLAFTPVTPIKFYSTEGLSCFKSEQTFPAFFFFESYDKWICSNLQLLLRQSHTPTHPPTHSFLTTNISKSYGVKVGKSHITIVGWNPVDVLGFCDCYSAEKAVTLYSEKQLNALPFFTSHCSSLSVLAQQCSSGPERCCQQIFCLQQTIEADRWIQGLCCSVVLLALAGPLSVPLSAHSSVSSHGLLRRMDRADGIHNGFLLEEVVIWGFLLPAGKGLI